MSRASKAERLATDLREIAGRYRAVALASSFGAEDMVLTDVIARERIGIAVFTLDTGRLPEETYRLMHLARARYAPLGLAVEIFAPEAGAIAAYGAAHGPNGFYESVELRKNCCAIRKVEPLRRALAGRDAWLTGQRREQAATRAQLAFEERDAQHGIAKFNPLCDWSTDEVWDYIRTEGVPYNALHDQGYASIGCAPCTRAIEPGEDLRAGRWWWENRDSRECGLHQNRRAS